MNVGIEDISIYGGTACLDVMELAKHRKLDGNRFENLLMKQKGVALLNEDAVTFAVNAAAPMVQRLSQEEKSRIEMVITCTESGIDFGKSLSTYVHDYLGLEKSCRLFEIKQACYSGTAGYQMALNFILSGVSPGAKALVIMTDLARYTVAEGGDSLTEDWSYAEPSTGAGAVALLVSDNPKVFIADVGANGYYGHEVMDTCRPLPDSEAGDSDLSLLSFLDCCDKSYQEYKKKVPEADYLKSFNYLSFHTPFGGMIKGAHRNMMRKQFKMEPDAIETDFRKRVEPSLVFCQQVGNIMGGTVFLALVSTIYNSDNLDAARVGIFSYGSGCCSEFYSGVFTQYGQQYVKSLNFAQLLSQRYRLSIDEYETLLRENALVAFGTRNIQLDQELHTKFYTPSSESSSGNSPSNNVSKSSGKRLFLSKINEFHREYQWV
ncbi:MULTISPECIES: hydroxymethylglutaryl-CoA synthase family protein [unclassified Pseudoalteromonas]|uniref:hydroxymethylglutaryl-CoA synthase family protein n=1 Tax=unclassified Pseudoalteromonas TaxID=194690 RepID=UPI0025B4AF33|nr:MULTISPECIES: hydroxymethylglutaryl-CoA synthase family protein [unclassified Pseudoalteromonas]MDN3379149.1 hydroxymethylglutaryl-CoA synthase family protein [Pseudoalteromonas sp. APC 3893]MDN3387644.1 hydroxymethylglutaryl-CoA synthase family protein [Pseudoalteromonas sp. APC 4017]